MTFSAAERAPSLRLLKSATIDFPAASGIEYHEGEIFVFGDNATHLLILDTGYKTVNRIRFWNSDLKMIPKNEKPDLESAHIFYRNSRPILSGVGSHSTENRWKVFEYELGGNKLVETAYFNKGEPFPGIKELNIEGSTVVGNVRLFCNRANLSNPKNHLLFWNGGDSLAIKEMKLPKTSSVAGLSGLDYVQQKDLLFFTASEEATTNAYEDGAIGDSYLGWINNFSKKAKKNTLRPDVLICLRRYDKKFAGQKIESVCVESVSGNRYILHLAADNDTEKSVLFTVALQL